jgi:hypothetical protein
MPDVYELMFLPRLNASSYVLVTSRGASVAVRVYADAVNPPRRIDGKDLPSLPELAAEAKKQSASMCAIARGKECMALFYMSINSHSIFYALYEF